MIHPGHHRFASPLTAPPPSWQSLQPPVGECIPGRHGFDGGFVIANVVAGFQAGATIMGVYIQDEVEFVLAGVANAINSRVL
jgi:hypothetical protein